MPIQKIRNIALRGSGLFHKNVRRIGLSLTLALPSVFTSCSGFRSYPLEKTLPIERSGVKMLSFPQSVSSSGGVDYILSNVPNATTPTHYGDIDYMAMGKKGNAEVVLIHGTPSTWFSFASVIPRLADEYRVTAPSMPGHGYSTVTPAFDFMPDAYADALKEFIERNEISGPCLVGHSLGGEFVVRTFLKYRKNLNCRALVLINPWAPSILGERLPLDFTEHLWRVPFIGHFGMRLLGGLFLGEPLAFDKAFVDFDKIPHAGVLRQEIRRPYFGSTLGGLFLDGDIAGNFSRMCCAQNVLNSRIRYYQNETVMKMGGLTDIPVVVINSKQDKIVSPDYVKRLFEEIKRHNPSAVYLEADTGHMPMFETPEIIMQAVHLALNNSKSKGNDAR